MSGGGKRSGGVSLRAVAPEELKNVGERFSRMADSLREKAGCLEPVLKKVLECLPGEGEDSVATLVSFSENVEHLREKQEGAAEGSGETAEYGAFIARVLRQCRTKGPFEERRPISGGERLMGIFLRAAEGSRADHLRSEGRKLPLVQEETETGKRVGAPASERDGRRSFVGVSRLLGRVRELAVRGGGRDAERLEKRLVQLTHDMETSGEGLIDLAEKCRGGGASTGEAWADGLLERLRVPPPGEPGRGTAFLERFAAEAALSRGGTKAVPDVSAMGLKALERLAEEEENLWLEWNHIIDGLVAGVKANAKPAAEPVKRPVPDPECKSPPEPEPEAVPEPASEVLPEPDRGAGHRTSDVPEGRRPPADEKPMETRAPSRNTGPFTPRAGRRDGGTVRWEIEYMVKKHWGGGVTLEISGRGKGMTGLPALMLLKKSSSVPLHDEDGTLLQRIPAHPGLHMEIPLPVGRADTGCHLRLFLDHPSPRLDERTDLHCKGNKNKI